MYPEQKIYELEACKDSYKGALIWCLTRFTMYPQIPKKERDYYIELLIQLKVELRKTKTEAELDKTAKKIESIHKELERKYGKIFKRYVKQINVQGTALYEQYLKL